MHASYQIPGTWKFGTVFYKRTGFRHPTLVFTKQKPKADGTRANILSNVAGELWEMR